MKNVELNKFLQELAQEETGAEEKDEIVDIVELDEMDSEISSSSSVLHNYIYKKINRLESLARSLGHNGLLYRALKAKHPTADEELRGCSENIYRTISKLHQIINDLGDLED